MQSDDFRSDIDDAGREPIAIWVRLRKGLCDLPRGVLRCCNAARALLCRARRLQYALLHTYIHARTSKEPMLSPGTVVARSRNAEHHAKER